MPTGLVDGPLPTHYEPAESPVQNPLYKQQSSPVLKYWKDPAIRWRRSATRSFPYVMTTYRLTEHYLAGAMSRWLPWLTELQPELFVEISPELAQEKGITESRLGQDLQPAHADPRQGAGDAADAPVHRSTAKTIHQVGMPWHWGYEGLVNRRHRQRADGAGRRSERVDPRGQGVRVQRGESVAAAVFGHVRWQISDRESQLRFAIWIRSEVRRLMAEPMGFYTDTTVCIGCKACEVACKEWNQLPSTNGGVNTLSGDSYDNTRRLDGIHWRHVKFIEQFTEDRKDGRWLLMSDVCKHCVQAGCLEVCPTGAIIRTEFDTVVIQSDACNGCRDCIAACPFGVIDINPVSGTAQKCTLCYDRLQGGLEPACSKACPTESIQFGTISELRDRAQKRVEQLHQAGENTRLPLRRRREDARRAQLVLSAGGQAGSVRTAAGSEDADTQSRFRLAVFRARRRHGRLDRHLQFPQSRRTGRARGGAAMNGVPSSTWFTAPPDWGWLIVLYFFFGGLAGGMLFPRCARSICSADRKIVRSLVWVITSRFPACVISGLLLTVDLGRPERFWHMLIESNTYRPMFKYWSPMSIGSWALMIFGIFTFLSFLGALAEDERIYLAGLRARVRPPCDCSGGVIAVIGGIFGFYVAGYTGSPARGDQPSDLVRHASARHALRRLGGVDFGGIDDSAGERNPAGPCPACRPASNG